MEVDAEFAGQGLSELNETILSIFIKTVQNDKFVGAGFLSMDQR
jgi:hypothetical protein